MGDVKKVQSIAECAEFAELAVCNPQDPVKKQFFPDFTQVTIGEMRYLRQIDDVRRERSRSRNRYEKIYLAVPFEEKNLAKKCGARWDREEKKWWVTEDDFEKVVLWHRERRCLPIDCSFYEKDECRALGAQWNPSKRIWWIFAGDDPTPFNGRLSSKKFEEAKGVFTNRAKQNH